MKINNSEKLFSEAKKIMPGGVNSPVRAFGSVNQIPRFIKKGYGSKITDEDDNEYIDYVLSWGPLILGHSNSKIIDAVKTALNYGTSYGAAHKGEIEIANLIIGAFPSIEMVRLVNSGTEATMSTIRAARAYTGRELIVKFDGCYHGHFDDLLVKAGSGVATLGLPSSAGIPKEHAKNTIVLPFNNIEALKKATFSYKNKIACVIIEPVPANMGVIIPMDNFLFEVRKITYENEILLIFDEVITGFRLALGGAQSIYNIKPDLTCLGKIIGGGLPVGAYGGRKDIMQKIAPLGDVYQAGTLSGNPLAVAAGVETIKILQDDNIYKRINAATSYICDEILKISKKYNIKIALNKVGSMFTVFYTDSDVIDFNTAKTSNLNIYAKIFALLLDYGIYTPPSQFEALFLSEAHSSDDFERTIKATDCAFNLLK